MTWFVIRVVSSMCKCKFNTDTGQVAQIHSNCMFLDSRMKMEHAV